MIYQTLLHIAIFQGVVLGIIILKSKLFNTKANRYLAYLMFVLSLLLLNLALELWGAFQQYPILRFIDDVETAFLAPVFLSLFILKKGNHPLRNSRNLGWLFLPFGFSAGISILEGFDTITNQYTLPNAIQAVLEILNKIEVFLAVLFFPGVLIAAYRFLKYINQEKDKSWITVLWLLVSLIFFSWIGAIVVRLFIVYDVSMTMKIIALAATLFIHWTTYVGIYKFRLSDNREEISAVLDGLSVKISNPSIPEKEKLKADNAHFKKLEVLFKENKIYTDSGLNREQVARELGISPGYLSQLVNQVTGSNFSNYLNRYRVEAVKQMLLNSEFQNYSLLAMGLESGFTSKTTFFKVFKKFTGMTPSQYQKSFK
ncbi:Helix-turn-helix domain-containing protein [Robiginitalea myxolifaciens]|uniref:Helix-turn-helix domain-containing protein n=1 Tax=Robiginitalea myxolifaciens TaxID=400055 RepID=A0A1I6HL51_9FLAO|nr:helix-turn-helix domain-containing protein [Robiginitalea myxolifaciens]SFR55175.1 Helix-turn-helix domain-containing protein [Robiginitalea myxolifaciens]